MCCSPLPLSDDQTTVHIACSPLKEGFVYDVSCAGVLNAGGEALFPNVGFYTMNRVPGE